MCICTYICTYVHIGRPTVKGTFHFLATSFRLEKVRRNKEGQTALNQIGSFGKERKREKKKKKKKIKESLLYKSACD